MRGQKLNGNSTYTCLTINYTVLALSWLDNQQMSGVICFDKLCYFLSLNNSTTLKKGSDLKFNFAILALSNRSRSTAPLRTHRKSYPSIKIMLFSGFCFRTDGTFSDHPSIDKKRPIVCFPERFTLPCRLSSS